MIRGYNKQQSEPMAAEPKNKFAADDITDQNLVSRLEDVLRGYPDLRKAKITFIPGHLTIACPDGTIEKFQGRTAKELFEKFAARCFDVNVSVLQ